MGKSSQILQDCQLIDQIQLCFNISSKNKMFFSVQVVLREGLTRKKKNCELSHFWSRPNDSNKIIWYLIQSICPKNIILVFNSNK